MAAATAWLWPKMEPSGALRKMSRPRLRFDPNRDPVIALGDLPPAVQDTIRRQAEGVAVKDITTKKLGSETVYQVHYRANGTPVELLVGMDGKVVLPEGSLDREAPGAPIQAPVKHEELASAKVVNATENPLRPIGTGSSGSSQRGTVKSNPAGESTNSPAPAKVNIGDVPVPVQNAAKKLAGDATIDSISPKLSDGALTYEVAFQQNGTHRTVVVNKDGVVVSE